MSKVFLFTFFVLISIVLSEDPKVEKKVEKVEKGDLFDDPEVEVTTKVFENVTEILKDIRDNKLKDIFIRNVNVTEEDAKLIAEIISTQEFDRFALTKNKELSNSVLKIICSSFNHNKKLRVIGFTKNKIDDEGAAIIAEGIKNHENLQKLYLYNTEIGSKGMNSIASSLPTLKSLTKLVLIENKIGDEGTIPVAKYVGDSKITELIIRDCKVGSSGFKEISEVIKKSKDLQKVDFSENPMDIEAIKSFSNGISENEHLTHIELSFNNIDAEKSKLLFEGLSKNKFLKRVDLSENKIGEGAKELSSFLEKDTPLEKLDISNNQFSIENSKLVLNSLLKNKNMKKLFSFRNHVDETVTELVLKLGERFKSENMEIYHEDLKDDMIDEELQSELDEDDEDEEEFKEEIKKENQQVKDEL